MILNRAPLALFPFPNTRRESFTLNITGQRNNKIALISGPGAVAEMPESAITGAQAGTRGGFSRHCQHFNGNTVMGKRSAFKRRPLDTYDTPEAAVAPLLGHLPLWCRFWEPCAGQLDLVNHLERHGFECVVPSNIEPRDERVFRLDALATCRSDVDATGATHIITNPAWSRFILHPMILHFSAIRPTWLLFDADWVHTRQAARYLPHLRKIVSVDTSRLRQWFDKSVSWIDPREVAWCGAFVATCHRKALPGIELPKNSLGARNWQSWGQEVKPVLGATLVFWRGSKAAWQGHVGFYHAEDKTHFHVLGGNQSNSVNVTRIAKSRLLSARWPRGEQVTCKPVLVASNGIPISNNEA